MLGVEDIAGHGPHGPSFLKRDILFFDTMLLVHGEATIKQWRTPPLGGSPEYLRFADELEMLIGTPYFSASKPNVLRSGIFAPPGQSELPFETRQEALRILEQMKRLFEGLASHQPRSREETLRLAKLQSHLVLRFEAALQNGRGIEAVPNCVLIELGSGPAIKLEAGDVLQLAMNRVMVPDELTPWEDIFALKTDTQLMQRARKLRLWSRDVARQGFSLAQAEEYLSDTLADYEAYMNAHKIKFSSGLMRTAIVGAAELIEDIAKLRIGKLASRVFAWRERRSDMLMSELQAPGRAVSFVTVLNESLGKPH